MIQTQGLSPEELLRLTSLREVVGGFTHEMAQPLNAIMIAAQVLRLRTERSVLSEEDKSFLVRRLEMVSSQVLRATQILDELRSLSRGWSGEQSTTDVQGLFQRVHTLMGQQLVGRGIELNMVAPGDLPPIRGNRQVLELVLVQGLAFARDVVETVGNWHQQGGRPFKKAVEVRFVPADVSAAVVIGWSIGELTDPSVLADADRHVGLSAASLVLSAAGGELKRASDGLTIILP